MPEKKKGVLRWCGETAESIKKTLDKTPMAKAGRAAGRMLHGRKR